MDTDDQHVGDTATDAPVVPEVPVSENGSDHHLDAIAQKLLDRPLAERIRHLLADTIIVHPRLAGLLNEVHWLLQEPARFRARGLIIHAGSGNGKTAIAEILMRQFPLRTISNPAPSVVAISLAGARTTRTVLERLHEALKSDIGRGTISAAEQRAHAILRRCGCRLLILDEAQDVSSFRESEQKRVIETLKHAMNSLKLPILALGTDDAVSAFKVDPHMQARFVAMPLPTWQANDEFAGFLREYEKRIPLPKPSGLYAPEIMKYLVGVAEGVLDPMLTCIKNTAVRALAEGKPAITLDDLKAVAVRPHVNVLGSR